jgi:AraC-like DNA-binding protein
MDSVIISVAVAVGCRQVKMDDRYNRRQPVNEAMTGRAPPWLLRQDTAKTAVPTAERMAFDDDYWHATIERLDLDSGLRVYLTRAEVRRPFVLEPHQADAGPWLMAHLAVRGRVPIGFSDGQSVEIGPDRAALFRPADRHARFSPAGGQSLRLVGFMITADRVRRIFGGSVPAPLEPLIADEIETSHVLSAPVNPTLRRLAALLFTTRLHDRLRTVFIEGIVLQHLALMTAHATSAASPGALLSRDRARLQEARDRLLADLRSPPTAGELATAVGWSDCALDAGFRALFGGSVYQILRNARLEQARIALETDGASVKQIADRIGYSHVSNFISAFSRRYGQPPGRYMRDKRRSRAGIP